MNCKQIHVNEWTFYFVFVTFYGYFVRWNSNYLYVGLAKKKNTEDRYSVSRFDITDTKFSSILQNFCWGVFFSIFNEIFKTFKINDGHGIYGNYDA